MEHSVVSFLCPLSVFLKVVPPRTIERLKNGGQYCFSKTLLGIVQPFKHEKVGMLTNCHLRSLLMPQSLLTSKIKAKYQDGGKYLNSLLSVASFPRTRLPPPSLSSSPFPSPFPSPSLSHSHCLLSLTYHYSSDSQRVVPGPVASSSPGNLLEVRILGPLQS